MSYPYYFARGGFAARRLFPSFRLGAGSGSSRAVVVLLGVATASLLAGTEALAASNAKIAQTMMDNQPATAVTEKRLGTTSQAWVLASVDQSTTVGKSTTEGTQAVAGTQVGFRVGNERNSTATAGTRLKPEHSVLGPYSWAKAGEVPDYFGAVLQGQSLWRVARRINAALGVSVEQLAIGLYEANPEAFSGGSIDALQAGSYLRIPSLAEVKTYSHVAAKAQLELYMGGTLSASMSSAADSTRQSGDDASSSQLQTNVTQPADVSFSGQKSLQLTEEAGRSATLSRQSAVLEQETGAAETLSSFSAKSIERERPLRIEAPLKARQLYWVWMVLPASLLTLFIVLWRTRRPMTPAGESQRQIRTTEDDAEDATVEPVHVQGRSRNGSVVENGDFGNQTDFSKLRSRSAIRQSEREPVAGVTLEEFSGSSLTESTRVEPKLHDENSESLLVEEEIVLRDVVEPALSELSDDKTIAEIDEMEKQPAPNNSTASTSTASTSTASTSTASAAKQNLGSADQRRETWTKKFDSKLLKAQQHREFTSEFDQELTQLIKTREFAVAKRLLDSSRGEALDEPHYHYQRLRLMYEAEDEHGFYEYLNRVEHKLKSADAELQAKLDKLQTLLN